MINLDKEKYQGATADKINDYNWAFKEKIDNSVAFFTGSPRLVNRNTFDIWDPLELKDYIYESIQ